MVYGVKIEKLMRMAINMCQCLYKTLHCPLYILAWLMQCNIDVPSKNVTEPLLDHSRAQSSLLTRSQGFVCRGWGSWTSLSTYVIRLKAKSLRLPHVFTAGGAFWQRHNVMISKVQELLCRLLLCVYCYRILFLWLFNMDSVLPWMRD